MKKMSTNDLILHTLEDVKKTATTTGILLTDGVTAKVLCDVLERAKEISFTPIMLNNVITEGFRLAIALKGEINFPKRKYTRHAITKEIKSKRKYTRGDKPIGRPRKVVQVETAMMH